MKAQHLVILGTGGTIAGKADNAGDNIGYTAAQVGVEQLLDAVPGLSERGPFITEQVAQLDSKDMSFAVWAQLAARVSHFLCVPAPFTVHLMCKKSIPTNSMRSARATPGRWVSSRKGGSDYQKIGQNGL